MARKRRSPQTPSEPRRQSGSAALPAWLATGRVAIVVTVAVYLVVVLFLFRQFLFDDSTMLFGSDTIPDGVYTRQYYQTYHAEYGGIPRWNPYILGGLPFIDAMHGDTFYPAAWLKFFMPLTRALGQKLVWHVLLAGITMFLFLRVLRIRREAAFLGGLMYLLAPSFVSWLYGGHDAKMYVIALLPLAFACLELLMRNPRVLWTALLGAVMGLLILTSQIQMAYYSYWALGLYFVVRLFVPDRCDVRGIAARSGGFGGAVVLALLLGAVQFLPAYMFSTSQSVRAGEERTGYEYATSFSLNAEEVAGMIVPSFSGAIDGRLDKTSRGNLYWGKNFFKLNTEYHGILPIVFGLLALWACRDRMRWFYLGLAALALIYAVGASTPLFRIFYDVVPGVKHFRAPSMIIFLFGFAFTVLAARFLSDVMDGTTDFTPGDARLLITAGSALAVALILSILGGRFFDAWTSVFYPGITDSQRQLMHLNVPLFTGDLWRVAFLTVVGLMGVWMVTQRRMSAPALAVLITAAAVVDGVFIDSRFITVIDPETYPGTAPDAVVRELTARLASSPMPFRTLGLDIFGTTNSSNYYAQFGIPVADGRHNNELQTYDRFKGGRTIENFTALWLNNNQFVPDGIERNNFLRVAGVKYLVFPAENGGTQLVENQAALDRAYIVHNWMTVPDDVDAVDTLLDPGFDPGTWAVVTGESPFEPPGAGVSRVTDYEVLRDGWRIVGELDAPGLLILTENNVPYWQATVDGVPAPILTAYGTFMAVPCDAGTHEVVLRFVSAPYNTGKRMTQLGLVAIVAMLAGSGVSAVRTKRKFDR